MSFSTSVSQFAQQAARERAQAFGTRIRTNTTPARTLTVFLSPWQVVRDIGDAGMIETVKAQLRVQTACVWQPVNGVEFTVVATGEVARINSVAAHPSSAEWVCDVARLSP